MCVMRTISTSISRIRTKEWLKFGEFRILHADNTDTDRARNAKSKWYNNTPPNTVNMTSVFELLRPIGKSRRPKSTVSEG